jgi:hypothetical protein
MESGTSFESDAAGGGFKLDLLDFPGGEGLDWAGNNSPTESARVEAKIGILSLMRSRSVGGISAIGPMLDGP